MGETTFNPFETRRLGGTDVRVTRLGFGGATLGDAREQIDEARASATIEAAHVAGIGYFDTAPWYGLGKSEYRFGAVLRTKPRESFVLSTKIGRVLSAPPRGGRDFVPRRPSDLPFELRFDYTRDGVLRSHEDSLTRMGLGRVDALLIHDLDTGYHGDDAGVEARLHELDGGGGFRALADLKAQGAIGAIGAGINVLGMVPRFLQRFPLDFFIIAMPYTLLSQEALAAELPLVQRHGASVVIGAPFASGILVRGPEENPLYGYRPAESPVVEKTRRIAAVCQRHGVLLPAAALRFPLAHPAVAAVIPGPNAPEQVRLNLQSIRQPIPAQLWAELKAESLIHADAPTP